MKNISWYVFGIILLSIIIFSPSIGNFFFGDDWFHLRISEISSPGEFFNFFSFSQTPQSTTFYRPISTQVFHFLFGAIFGLNPFPYHVFILLLFATDLYLLFRVVKKITGSTKQSLLTLFLYGISATHFVKFYYLAASQEIIMLFFGLLMIVSYLRKPTIVNRILSVLFFVLAILSRETAIILPVVLLIIDWGKKEFNFRRVIPYLIILIPYLYFRLFIFGGTLGDSYIWDFSIKRAINTLGWYTLWSVGVPELLVDYTSSGFKLLPRFFTDLPNYYLIILTLTGLSISGFAFLVLKNIRKLNRKILSSVGIFLIGVSPVIFLPWHKFALELTIAMIGFCMVFSGFLIKEKIKILSLGLVILYIALNLWTNFLNYKINYSVRRAQLSQNIFNYFNSQYPKLPENAYFEFLNDTPDFGQAWGSSKQVAAATSRSDLFKVLYKNPSVEIYFQDFADPRPKNKQKIEVSSYMFLK